MNCSIIKDLIPLYIDNCVSRETAETVKEHLEVCEDCRAYYEQMITPVPTDSQVVTDKPKSKQLEQWKASLIQSALLLISFCMVTIGVFIESRTGVGFNNGFAAFNFVVPATGFLISIPNWYFLNLYKSRRSFTRSCTGITLITTAASMLITAYNYDMPLYQAPIVYIGLPYWIGAVHILAWCFAANLFSDKYAQLLGKE